MIILLLHSSWNIEQIRLGEIGTYRTHGFICHCSACYHNGGCVYCVYCVYCVKCYLIVMGAIYSIKAEHWRSDRDRRLFPIRSKIVAHMFFKIAKVIVSDCGSQKKWSGLTLNPCWETALEVCNSINFA